MEFGFITGFGALKPMRIYDMEERDEYVPERYSDISSLDYASEWHIEDREILVMVSERDEVD
jgi:hypothetical protein